MIEENLHKSWLCTRGNSMFRSLNDFLWSEASMFLRYRWYRNEYNWERNGNGKKGYVCSHSLIKIQTLVVCIFYWKWRIFGEGNRQITDEIMRINVHSVDHSNDERTNQNWNRWWMLMKSMVSPFFFQFDLLIVYRE